MCYLDVAGGFCTVATSFLLLFPFSDSSSCGDCGLSLDGDGGGDGWRQRQWWRRIYQCQQTVLWFPFIISLQQWLVNLWNRSLHLFVFPLAIRGACVSNSSNFCKVPYYNRMLHQTDGRLSLAARLLVERPSCVLHACQTTRSPFWEPIESSQSYFSRAEDRKEHGTLPSQRTVAADRERPSSPAYRILFSLSIDLFLRLIEQDTN